MVKAYMVIAFLLCGMLQAMAQKPGNKITDAEHYTGKMVIVGTHGGIVNMRNETIILATGEVFYHNNVVKEYKYLKTLDAAQTARVFKLSEKPGLMMKFNHPGNMSTFMETWNKGKIKRSYIWGEPGVKVPSVLDKSYSEIINIINKAQ